MYMDYNGVKMEAAFERKTEYCCKVVHTDRVLAARASASEPALIGRLGELFKVFSDTTRLRILEALAGGELCVCDLGAVLGASQSAVSHQLALLRAARLVAYRRQGKMILYRLADDHVGRLIRLGLDHAVEGAPLGAGEPSL